MPVTFGRYELGELLGRGGMGEVFRAYDTVRDRTVALKVLPPHLAEDASFTARFRRESRLAAQLNEAHIIPIHDFGEIDGRLFIDMRLVEGRDLSAVLTERGTLTADVAVEIVVQLASALDAAHERGLVHRDVKPSNVLLAGLRPDPAHVPFAYLVDFGIARSIGGGGTKLTTTAGTTIGTVAYMAPERISGASGDARADVYALACVLYEALTGTTPFGGEPFAMMYAHVNSPPPRAGDRVGGVPPELDDVISTGMAKEPTQRYASAGEFAAAAQSVVRARRVTGPVALVSGPVPIPPAQVETAVRREEDTPTRIVSGPRPLPPAAPPAPPSAPPRPRRRRWWPVAAVLAVAVLVAGAVVLLTRDGSAPKRPPSGPLGATARAEVKSGGTMTWGLANKITNFNPFTTAGDTRETNVLASALLPKPFHYDHAGVPSVDTDYFTAITQTSADPMTIEYKINPKAVWSDGTRLSYADFAGQQQALVQSNDEHLFVPGYDQISSVKPGNDDQDVIVTFTTPFSDWRNLFAPLLPKSLTADADAFLGAWAAAPAVTSAPFRWQGADASRTHYTITRNPSWWVKDEPAKLDSIVFAVAGDQRAALRAHKVDYGVLTGPRAVNPSATIKGTAGYQARSDLPTTGFRAIVINTREPPLNDERVRQAIALTINRTAVAQGTLGTQATALQNHFYTPGAAGYRTTCGQYCTPNVTKAKALLASAGWRDNGTGKLTKDGKPLSVDVTYPSDTTYFSEAKLIVAQLNAVGFTSSGKPQDGEPFAAAFSKGTFQVAMREYLAGRYPLSNLLLDYRYANGSPAFNPNGAGTPALDAMLAQALKATTIATRDDDLAAVSTAMWDNAAFLPLYPRNQPTVVVTDLVNIGAFGLGDARWADIGYRK